MNRFFDQFRKTPITLSIITLNTILLIDMVLLGGIKENLIPFGGLYPALIKEDGSYYRFLTSMFLHGDILHYASNNFVLYFLGGNLERILGKFRFSILYLNSGLVGSVAVFFLSDPDTVTIGSSGAIFGVMGGLLVLSFVHGSWFTEIGKRNIRNLAAINLIFTFVFPFISIWGHLGGLVGGMLLILLLTPKIPDYIKKDPRYRVYVDHNDHMYDA